MFDLISGGERHPFHDKTAAPVVVSVTGHAVVLTLVVVLPFMFATSKLPVVPTMMAFVAAPPAPPPPPPPPAPAAAKPASVPAEKPLVASANPNAAPVEAPDAVFPEPLMPMSRGGEGGVEGGIEGGVAGGIVGGLIAAPPPPPPPVPPSPPAPTQPVRVGGQIQVPKLVKRVEPIYPDFAIAADVTGMVILEAVVDGSGSVQSVRVLRSVKLLDGAAIDAVKQWRYEPLSLNGVPTPFILTVTLTFAVK